MQKTFIEAVFEGDYKSVRGYLEGFVAALGIRYGYFICSDSGVESETMAEQIREWISLGTRIHHVLMEDGLFEKIRDAMEAAGNSALVNSSCIKSTKQVKGAFFRFRFETYGRKYAEEIKELLRQLPEGVTLSEYTPVEKIDEDCKGVELYTVCHDYVFSGDGLISGDVGAVIRLRSALDAHPLIEAEKVRLDL
jgi:hypothetical protein